MKRGLLFALAVLIFAFAFAPPTSQVPLQCVDTGTANAAACTVTLAMTPVKGDSLIFTSTVTANTGDATLAVNGGSAFHFRKWMGSSVLAAGDRPNPTAWMIVFDGTFWEVPTIGNAPSGGTTNTIASGTAALTTTLIASGSCDTTSVGITATGVAATDTMTYAANADISGVTGWGSTSGFLTIYPYPGSNVVNFKVCNWTGSSITPGAVTLNWRVVR